MSSAGFYPIFPISVCHREPRCPKLGYKKPAIKREKSHLCTDYKYYNLSRDITRTLKPRSRKKYRENCCAPLRLSNSAA